MSMDQDPLGPWCYTTDPDIRYEHCGVCEVPIEESIEFGHHNDSWIPIVVNSWLEKQIHINETKLQELRKELQVEHSVLFLGNPPQK